MTNNLLPQAATMELHGAPNDVIANLNPLSIIILVPIMDHLVYPAFRKAGIRFNPIARITTGFAFASAAMISACVTQYYIYQKSPCGNAANSCEDQPAPINVWVQILPYTLIGASEIMASITSLEYAYTKAPKNMRSMVQAVSLATSAISSALAQALVGLADDPLLVWNYGVVAVLAAFGGTCFWLTFRKLDADEDQLNMLPDTNFEGRGEGDAEKADVSINSRTLSNESSLDNDGPIIEKVQGTTI
jgi:POT family proton-dependent oligopeptide transporter